MFASPKLSFDNSAVKPTQHLVRTKTIIIIVTLLTFVQFNHVEFPARSQRINFSHKFLLVAQVTATPIPTSLETLKGSSSHMKFSVRSTKQPLKLNNNFNDSLGVVMTTARKIKHPVMKTLERNGMLPKSGDNGPPMLSMKY